MVHLFSKLSHYSDNTIEGKIFSLHDGATLHGPYDKLGCPNFVKSFNGG
jgi:hypothetical protein